MPGSSDTEGFSKRGVVLNFLHIPAYSVLAFFLIQTLHGHALSWKTGGERCVLFLVFGLAVSFGILNEFVQASVPGREFSLGDMLRNALGAILTISFYKKK